MKRCHEPHPIFPQVRCEERVGHTDDHFNSFYNRRWEIIAEGDFKDEGTPATLGPCGCTDYHMADCPILTDRQTTDDPPEPDDDEHPFDEEDEDEAEA